MKKLSRSYKPNELKIFKMECLRMCKMNKHKIFKKKKKYTLVDIILKKPLWNQAKYLNMNQRNTHFKVNQHRKSEKQMGGNQLNKFKNKKSLKFK